MVSWNSLWLSWNGDYWHTTLGSAPCPVEPGWPLQDGGPSDWLAGLGELPLPHWLGHMELHVLWTAASATLILTVCVCEREPRLAILYWSSQWHVLPELCTLASCCATAPLFCVLTKSRTLNEAEWICCKHTLRKCFGTQIHWLAESTEAQSKNWHI